MNDSESSYRKREGARFQIGVPRVYVRARAVYATLSDN